MDVLTSESMVTETEMYNCHEVEKEVEKMSEDLSF